MNRTPTVATAFAVVLMSVVLAALLTAIVGLSLDPETGRKFLIYLSIFIGQGFMAVPLILYLLKRRVSLVKSLRLNPVESKDVLATVLIAVGAVFISEELDHLMEFLIADPQMIENIGEYLLVDSFGAGLLLFIGVGIFAPIGEELLFRGYLQQFLEKHWQDVTKAVLVTALTFALIHLNPYWVIQAYLMGVVLGYLAWRTNSVLPAIICHGVYNSLALLISNLFPTETAFYYWGSHVSPLWLLLAAGITAAGFYLLHNRVEVTT